MGSFSPRLAGDHHFPIIFLPRRQRLLSVASVLLLLISLFNYNGLIKHAASAAAASPSSSPKSSKGSSNSEQPSPGDLKFYKNSEEKIIKTLESFPEEDLSKEVKLTRVKRSNGTSQFLAYGGKSDKPLFSWSPGKASPGKNLTSGLSVNSLLIGGGTGGGTSAGNAPFGWMNGAFIAMRKINGSSKANQTHYYAMVVYARKDEDGMVLEWDRLSPNLGKAVEGRKTASKAQDLVSSITQDTFLCAYGTCSCRACKGCDSDELSDEEERSKLSGFGKQTFNTKNFFKNAELMITGSKARNKKGDKSSNAYASAISKGKGTSKATASSKQGSAMAQSQGGKGGNSVSVAKGQVDAVAEANSKGGGDAKAMSMTNEGFAQSSSQSAGGGDVQSMAGKSGGDKDYQNYEDIEVDKDDDFFDAASLFQETDQAFEMADKRSNFIKMVSKGEVSGDMCDKEPEMTEQMDKAELGQMMKEGGDRDTKKGMMNARKRVFYRDPLRFGMDVDGGVNRSVGLGGETGGFVVKREKCCGLSGKEDSDVMDLLDDFGQECGGLLQEQVERLQDFKPDQVKKLMQTKKLSPTQHRDLVPMVLLKVFKDQDELGETLAGINELFGNSTGEKVSTATALVVNAAVWTSRSGKQHKVKIYRGLGENAQSVWTGVLLEYKMCTGEKPGGGGGGKKGGKKKEEQQDCSGEYKERLEAEMNLALGAYLFLKYADARVTTLGKETSAGEAFTSFLQLHNLNIAKQVYCKSKRVTGKGKE